MTTGGMTAVYSVVAIGLFNSIMFPTIFTLGVAKLGVQTDNASSLLVMAIVGGALVPLAQGCAGRPHRHPVRRSCCRCCVTCTSCITACAARA